MAIMQTSGVYLINVHDYPSSSYSAYWEILRDGNDADGYEYGVRIYSFDDGRILREKYGDGATLAEIDTAAQTWVLQQMPDFVREGE